MTQKLHLTPCRRGHLMERFTEGHVTNSEYNEYYISLKILKNILSVNNRLEFITEIKPTNFHVSQVMQLKFDSPTIMIFALYSRF
jgi:hypothetical protein